MSRYTKKTEITYDDFLRLEGLLTLKAGTHAAVVQLLARTIELAFALDGYASAKYLWRGDRSEAVAPTPDRSTTP